METFRKSFLITFLLGASLALAFTAGYLFHQYQDGGTGRFKVLDEAYGLIEQHALVEIPTAPAMEYGMIRGMLQAYNEPHTYFLEPVQNELANDNLHGSFGGIGVSMQQDADKAWLLYPFPEGPAKEAGIQDGDYLVTVDALQVTPEITAEQIQAAVRGPVGTTVKLAITRPPDMETLEFEIEREEIALPSVTWHVEPSEPRLGVVEINIIAETTPAEVEKAFADLQAQGATHFVLDLRNNGGGLLTAGVNTARLFLEEGEIMQQQYRGQEAETYRVEKPGSLSGLPLVVLVNENTASAAEIIAGAIQARGRAVLIGTPTYGKDTVQLSFTLQDSSNLRLTAAHWWIPGLEFPREGRGLFPEVELEIGAPSEAVLEAVKQALFAGETGG